MMSAELRTQMFSFSEASVCEEPQHSEQKPVALNVESIKVPTCPFDQHGPCQREKCELWTETFRSGKGCSLRILALELSVK